MTARTTTKRAFQGFLSRERTKTSAARRSATAMALVLAGLLLSQVATAKVVYRWINDAGRPEVSHSIPPDAVHRGYDILDGSSGRLISKVPPQMTEEEYEAQVASEEAHAQCQRVLRRLYTLYENLDDIHEAEGVALRKLDVRVENANQDLLNARQTLKSHESTAARAERNGDSISDKTLEAITKVNNQIATIERELGQREEERLDMQRDYQLERLMFESNSCDVEVSVAASD